MPSTPTTKKRNDLPGARALALACLLAACAAPALAAPPLTLPALFARAWERQPEAQGDVLRQAAAQATRQAADAWTPEPPALELQTRTDRPGSQLGRREYEAGLAVPLWLPGERARKAALAEAERQALDGRRRAAQLQLAGRVREAWWAHQKAQADLALARGRLASAQGLAADVARRVAAGDLARADQYQADAAVAQAEAAVAEAEGAHGAARAALSAWAGEGVGAGTGAAGAESGGGSEATLDEAHPALAEPLHQAAVARRAAELAAVQGRANPELTVAAAREREQAGERYRQSLTVGLRLPLGGGVRAQAKEAAARAEALEAEARVAAERDRLAAELQAAAARQRATAAQRDALARHAALARDTRGFIDKAFRLGEADWPTRQRAELEAMQAEQQWTRARIEADAAVSALRQARGQLPE